MLCCDISPATRVEVLETLCGFAHHAHVHMAAVRVQCVARGARLRRDKRACDAAVARMARVARGAAAPVDDAA